MKSGSILACIVAFCLAAGAANAEGQPALVIKGVSSDKVRIYDEQFTEVEAVKADEFLERFLHPLSVVINDLPYDQPGLEVQEVNSGLLMYRIVVALKEGQTPASYWVEGVDFEVFPSEETAKVCPTAIVGAQASEETQKDITTGFGGCVG